MERQNKPLAIFQMGSPPEDMLLSYGEQSDWIAAALTDNSHRQLRVIRPSLGEQLPSHADISGAVFTGSWSMVTDRIEWSERTAQWIRDAMILDLPLLGICYGHQLIAHALGGTVDYHPQGREIGQQRIYLSANAGNDAIFSSFPTEFRANLTHEQSVLIPPKGSTVLGYSSHDPHQILRYGPYALSVQFHPEFSIELMKACLLRREEIFCEEGFDIHRMCGELTPTPEAQYVLQHFATQLKRWN